MSTRRALLVWTFALVSSLPLVVVAQGQRRISLTQLEAMFANMRAKTKWDVDGPLLWGYFFFDPSQEKLKQVAAELAGTGYRVVNLEAVPSKGIYRLHVERVEVHTPASLDARNNEFYSLAEKYSIASYDGMDVGPAPTVAK